jgi:hypothetical protein
MPGARFYTLLFVVFAVLSLPLPAAAFSFTEEEQQERMEELPESGTKLLRQLHCPASLKSAKIATMIGEVHRSGGGRSGLYGSFMDSSSPDWEGRSVTNRAVYGNVVDELNSGFRLLGLRTYSSAEINAQIARAEQEAVLNNDPDAAIAAAERLSASFMLKGLISTHSQVNRVVNVDEVFVTINLQLIDRQGRQIASAQMSETTFSDADVLNTIHNLVKKQSHTITYKLFREYCQGGK